MGKSGELWDDSALVDAFDRAVASYKEMHGKSKQAKPCEDGKPEDVAGTAEVGEPITAEAADEDREKVANCDNTPCGLAETPQQPSEERQAVEQASLQETDQAKDAHVSDSKTLSSDATDADGNVSSTQQTLEYNELLRQYYELEEKSRNVLEQLQQTNYWNYQAPGYASTTQQQQIPAYSATAPDPHSSTTQSSCCYWNVPLVSVSCCSGGQPSEGSACMLPSSGCSVSLTCDQCPGASTMYPSVPNFLQFPTKVSTNDDQVAKAAMMTAGGALNFMKKGDQCPGASTTYPNVPKFMQFPTEVSTNDDQVAKAAMMTAEGALNFMRSAVSGQPGSQRNEPETGKVESTSMGMNPNLDTTGADSDLAVLLNAWYAAGFYTGRHIALQSMKNSKQ